MKTGYSLKCFHIYQKQKSFENSLTYLSETSLAFGC